MGLMPEVRPVILIADDTPANLGVLFELLSASGFEVLIAEDGQSALERAKYARPTLILLDIMMPGMNGFETCRRLKEDGDTREIPVLFMTALGDTADKVKGLELGAVDYIVKPFQHQEVLARVNTHLTMHKLKTELKESEERLSRMFESAIDAIVALDGNGRITLFNAAAETVFRCTAREVAGKPFERFTSDGLRQVLADHMGGCQPEHRHAIWLPEGLAARRATGELFPIEATLSCVEANAQTLFTLILRDIGERKRLQGQNRYLQDEARAEYPIENLIGAEAGLSAVVAEMRQVADTDATVLITGETGTGKELVARAVHGLSARSDKLLVTLNCATIPENLVESELFGHEKGAFTGALTRKMGRFELADGGTIFLDEIGELPLDSQAKLLRVLQEGEFERIGNPQTLKVDVRVIAATNRDLEEEARAGRFRFDLFYRLNVFPVHLPPLRKRAQDIPLLTEHFVRKYSAKFGRKIDAIPARVMAALTSYAWPGNVRELQHLIERAVIVTRGSELAFGDWLNRPSEPEPAQAKAIKLEDVERAHIEQVLKETGWRVSGENGAAQHLGIPPSTLESRMKKLGIARKS
jgi:PAS domain S-box-containing protein